MSYQIRYGTSKYDKIQSKTFNMKFLAVSLLAVALIAGCCFPAQLRQLRRHALPFLESEITSRASQIMIDIESGKTPTEAVAAFCREVIFEKQDTH